MMSRLRFTKLSLLFLVMVLTSIRTAAQSQVFSLPEAHLGEAYQVEIETVLRDKYGLRLKSSSKNAIIQWAFDSGQLPPGLSMKPDGTICGVISAQRIDDFRFALKVIDVSIKSQDLILNFSLTVNQGRLRLTKIEGPRLVPMDSSSETKTGGPLVESAETGTSPETAAATTIKSGLASASPSPAASASPTATDLTSTAATSKDLTAPFSSLNKRFILGFEQSGAASADSVGKPFFDLFINTPLTIGDSTDDGRPKVSVWGDVCLTSTPEQINAFADVAANSVSTITGGKLNQLTSAFDFVVGPEFRLKKFDHTDVGLIAAFGAVSPLTPRQSAQIFQVPNDKSSQAAAFFKAFPGAKADGVQYIAFVAPDRDRFLRQYYGGLRFKSYIYDDDETLQKVFPAMFDVTFGQSEAVTGGRLHKFVVGLDGFYPLPFPDKSRFLYLFGSARFKAGGAKTITAPFILDTAPSNITVTDPKVFIADPVATNRDSYRIGFGVDLVELFKFAKAQGATQQANSAKESDLKKSNSPSGN